MALETCHVCDEDRAEYACPRCDERTCEDCFEPMTQFNAGNPTECLNCVSDREHEWRKEGEAREAEEKAAQTAKDKRNAEARARYRSPEAQAKRAEAKRERAAKETERRKAMGRALAEAMKGFGF